MKKRNWISKTKYGDDQLSCRPALYGKLCCWLKLPPFPPWWAWTLSSAAHQCSLPSAQSLELAASSSNTRFCLCSWPLPSSEVSSLFSENRLNFILNQNHWLEVFFKRSFCSKFGQLISKSLSRCPFLVSKSYFLNLIKTAWKYIHFHTFLLRYVGLFFWLPKYYLDRKDSVY